MGVRMSKNGGHLSDIEPPSLGGTGPFQGGRLRYPRSLALGLEPSQGKDYQSPRFRTGGR